MPHKQIRGTRQAHTRQSFSADIESELHCGIKFSADGGCVEQQIKEEAAATLVDATASRRFHQTKLCSRPVFGHSTQSHRFREL